MPCSTEPAALLRRSVEVLAAVVVLLGAWLTVEGGLAAYPTWLYVGPVTVPTLVIPPAILAVVVLSRWTQPAAAHRRRGLTDRVLLSIAGLTIGAGVYATLRLNLRTPGLYWAALVPLLAGVVLACGVLFSHGVQVVTATERSS